MDIQFKIKDNCSLIENKIENYKIHTSHKKFTWCLMSYMQQHFALFYYFPIKKNIRWD